MKKHLILFFSLLLFAASAQEVETFTMATPQGAGTVMQKFAVERQAGVNFSMLSAYALTYGDVILEYATKGESGEWTPFQHFPYAHELEAEGRVATEGIFFYETLDSFAIRALSSSDEVIIRLYHALSGTENTTAPQGQLAACNCVQPLICTRACWCPAGNCNPTSTPSNTTVTHLIVHHSAGGASASDYAQVVRSYYDLHVNTNGWSDIGYNYLIDPDGVIYEARGSGKTGAHFSCANGGTTGICIIGNYMQTNASDTAMSSLRQLLAWESCDKNIVLTDSSFHSSSQLYLAHVSTHRDANSSQAPNACPKGTVCPGDSLYAEYYSSVIAAASLACTQGVGLGESEQSFGLYPNPTSSELQIELSAAWTGESLRVQIFDLRGVLLLERQVRPHRAKAKLELSSLAAGSYVLQIQQGERRGQMSFVKE